MRVVFALALLWIVWVSAALYLCQSKQLTDPPMLYVDEPDAGPGILPAQAEADLPALLTVPCTIGPRNLPIVDPERTA